MMTVKRCDLHTHSDYSDGMFEPAKLITLAEEKGLSAVALCDHNTLRGLEEFFGKGEDSSVEAIGGVEITCDYNGSEVHIVGLGVREGMTALEAFLSPINASKIKSNAVLLQNLRKAGYDITSEDISFFSPKAVPNRVHFARALMAKGYISSVSEGFGGILSEKKGLYKPFTEKADAMEAIEVLRSVGACPVLAHGLVSLSYEQLCSFLPKATERGLMAVETVYSLYSDEDSRKMKELAEKYGLLESGGSDFHGENKPDISIGTGRGNLSVPLSFWERIKDRLG